MYSLIEAGCGFQVLGRRWNGKTWPLMVEVETWRSQRRTDIDTQLDVVLCNKIWLLLNQYIYIYIIYNMNQAQE